MILGVDATRLLGPRTGVGRYLEYLLREWSRQQELPFEQIRLFTHSPIADVPSDGRFSLELLPSRLRGIWWQAAELRRQHARIDLLFAPYTLPPWYRAPSVVANLGVLEGAHADRALRARARSWHYSHSAHRADRVIVNSTNTLENLIRYYGVDPDKMNVIWLGVDERFRPRSSDDEGPIEEALVRVFGAPAPYFLFVGKLSARRNVPALLEAFADFTRDRPDWRLLVVGPTSREAPIQAALERLRLQHAVLHIEHLDQATLALLYRGARAFVLPTEQEGFSATILEALASGCPVVTVDHPALRDGALHEAVVSIPEASPATLARQLRRLAEDDALHKRLSAAGPRYAVPFSWDETSRRTADLLADVAQRQLNRRRGPR